MKEIPIEFSSAGITLRGIFHRPLRDKKFPAVAFCHGYFHSNKIGPFGLYVQIARRLAHVGIGCLRFDCAGFGDSDGKYLNVTYRSLCQNLDNAMTFLGQRRGVDKNQLGIIGHSLGSNIAIDVASSNISIKGICLLSPNPTEASSRPKIFSKIELDDLRRTGVTGRKGIPASAKVYHPIHAGISFKKASRTIAKTLIVYGNQDPYYSHDQYMKLLETFKGEKSIVAVDGADHSYIPIETRPELLSLIVPWMKKIFDWQ